MFILNAIHLGSLKQNKYSCKDISTVTKQKVKRVNHRLRFIHTFKQKKENVTCT